jgi:hypothetical protein
VGIGAVNTSWEYELKVTDDAQITDDLLIGGDAWIHGNEVVTSDIIVKTDIERLNSKEILEKLNQLEGKSFKYKNKAELESIFQNNLISKNFNDSVANDSNIIHDEIVDIPNFPNGTQYGLIAQEVKEIFPETIKFDSITQLFGINYNAFVPLLLEAIKEQQVLIENLQQEIELLKSDDRFKSALTSNDISIDQSDPPLLYQNKPNPFNTDIEIEFYLPDNINRATINIYDLSGVQIKNYPVNQREKGSQIIRAEELSPGMYLYSLIADGNLIDTKRMVLTDY